MQGSLHGTPIRESLGTNDWGVAEKIRWETLHPPPPAPPPVAPAIAASPQIPNLQEAIRKFLTNAERGRKLKPPTLKKYRVLTSQLLAFAGERHVSELHSITVDFAREFQESWRDSPISATKKLERFVALCRFFVRSGWMPQNPAAEVTPPVCDEVPTLPFEPDEMEKILAAADDPRWHALIQVMRWSGYEFRTPYSSTKRSSRATRSFCEWKKRAFRSTFSSQTSL